MCGAKYIFETRGKEGIKIHDNGNTTLIPAFSPKNVYNVSGAGDTVLAVLGLCIGMGMDKYTAAKIANECAGYVVSQPGTTAIKPYIFDGAVDNVTRVFKSSAGAEA